MVENLIISNILIKNMQHYKVLNMMWKKVQDNYQYLMKNWNPLFASFHNTITMVAIVIEAMGSRCPLLMWSIR